MPETENPRSFVRPKPIPVPPHRGLKITARNSRIYTCEVPTRKQVAHENYARRKHQMTKCGYQSVNYKPYQSIGDVILDDKKLILSALGQDTDQIPQSQDHSDSSSSDSDSDDEYTQLKTPLAKDQLTSVPQATNYKPKQINDIRAQVNKGRKMINAVKLGFGLYRIVKEEQERKQAFVDEERRKKEEAAKSEMKPPSSDGENSDDDDIDDELKSLVIPLPPSPTLNTDRSFEEQHLDVSDKKDRPDSSSSTSSTQRWKRQNSTISATRTLAATPTVQVTAETPPESPLLQDMEYSRSSTEFFMPDRRNIASAPTAGHRSFLVPPKSAKSTSSLTSRRTRKARSPRPYSPVYSNINYEDSFDRLNVYRQLCALIWILEAMSQDQQPAVMPPITSCWKLKLLNEDPRFIRRRAEKDKITEKDWTLFKQDPNRFTQRTTSRRGTRRISIHPNFLQRLSNTASSGGSNPRPNVPVVKLSPGETFRSPRGSNASCVAGELAIPSHVEFDSHSQQNGDESFENQTSENPKIIDDAASNSFNEPVIRAVSAPPPSSPANGSPAERKTKIQRQKSFTVTTVYTPPANASRAIQKLRAKNRAAKAFKSSLSQKELDKLSGEQEDQQSRKDSRVSAWVRATGVISAKRFAAAAIAAFGTITLDHHVDKVPVEMKSKFEEISEEKALVLHDNLEIRDRNRLQILERKLMCLEMFNNMYKALDKMRSKSVVLDDETNEEMRQRVSEECKWYKDLIENLPDEVKDDLCCTLVLNKLAVYGSLEGRKISSSQFVKVLSTLRVWEICSPDISAAIEFVREKVVEMSEEDYEEWFRLTFPQPKRAASAPPSRTSGFRY